MIHEISNQPYVKISLAPDDMELESHLFHLCTDGLSAYVNIDRVISRQLGYSQDGCYTHAVHKDG